MSDRLTELTCRYLDRVITPDEFAELDALIARDPNAAALFRTLSIQARALTEPLRDHIEQLNATNASPPTSAAGAPIYRKGYEPKQKSAIGNRQLAIFSALAATLLAACGVAIYVFALNPEPSPPDSPEPAAQPLANLIENASGGTLTTPGGFISEGRDYPRGEYTLSGGSAEFMLTNSVNIKLHGETRMSMHNDMHVSLTRGSAEFVVPARAKGFTVHLPDKSKIVDLGTVFRVETDDTGKTKLHVTKGSVEVHGREDSKPLLVEAGATVRVALGRAELLQRSSPIAGLVHEGLSIHYRADDVDGFGTPGNNDTVRLTNLADRERHAGVLVNAAGIVHNSDRIGTPFEYGIVLDSAKRTHIETNYQIAGGVNKAAAATWEFWLRADRGFKNGSGPLYGEFPKSGSAGSANRQYLALLGIGKTDSHRRLIYGMFPPGGGSTESDAGIFDTGVLSQIVVTKDQDTLTYYRNGSKITATKTNSTTYTGQAIARTLLGIRGNHEDAFGGQFNIIRIYDSALTAQQVQANYEAEHRAAAEHLRPDDKQEPQTNPLTPESETADR